MLRILLLFFAMIAAIIAGPMLVGHQGKIIIEMAGYSIKTSVTAFGIMLFLFLLAIATVLWFIRYVLRVSSRTKNWFFDSKYDRAERMTQAGMLKLVEGDYTKAEKLLVNSAPHASQPMVNYLLAAESAQKRSDLINTNQYLELAAKSAGSNQVPVDISRVRIQIAHGNYDLARNGIDKLLQHHPRHPEVLRLAPKAYQASGAYQEILDLWPILQKLEVYESDELVHIKEQAYIGLVQQQLEQEGCDGLKLWWSSLPKKARNTSELRVFVAKTFIDNQKHDVAEQIIVEGLKQEYNEGLIALIPKLDAEHIKQPEQLLWKLIKKHGETPLLNSTIAQLLIQHGDWKSANEKLHKAIEQAPTAQDYALLADTYEHLSQTDDANRVRREALQLTLKTPPESE